MSIKTFDDLVAAIDVSEALWVATACPTRGLACDAKFLLFLDPDGNKRVRVEELRAAVRWTRSMLRDTKGCDEASDTLQIDRLSDEASALRDSASLVADVLEVKGKALTVGQVRASEQALREAGINGDGAVAAETIKDEKLAALARTMLEVLPGVTNRAGKKAVDAATLEAFRKGRQQGLERLAARDEVFAWGDATLDRAEQLLALAPRLDEYFMQGRLVAAQPEASPLLRLSGERVAGALGDQEALSKAANALPIARPNPDGVLRWSELVHGPSFEALDALRREVFEPILGPKPALSEADYRAVRARAERARAWRLAADDKVVGLGEALRGIDEAQLDALAALQRDDIAYKPRLDAIEQLEKLALFQRWLLAFANNFISMPDLYSLRRSAMFERGRLVLGGRLFTLAVLVPDRAAHAALATTNTMCLAYLKIEGKPGADPFEVVVPVTSGNSSGITVGKRGIFNDTEGNEYDATIVQVVMHPVSLWEAMTQPFTRVGHFISSKIQSFGESSEKSFDTHLASTAGTVSKASAAAPAPPPPPAPAAAAAPAPSPLGGTIASGGLALAAVGSAAAFMLNQLQSLTILDVIRALIAITVLVMVPAGLVGWLKLRRRNLAILLEGSGWALNDRLLLTRPLGRLFTRRPPLPEGSRVDRTNLIPTIEARDEDEGNTGRGLVITLFVLALIATLAWEFRGPLWSGAKLLLPQAPPAASSAAPAASGK